MEFTLLSCSSIKPTLSSVIFRVSLCLRMCCCRIYRVTFWLKENVAVEYAWSNRHQYIRLIAFPQGLSTAALITSRSIHIWNSRSTFKPTRVTTVIYLWVCSHLSVFCLRFGPIEPVPSPLSMPGLRVPLQGGNAFAATFEVPSKISASLKTPVLKQQVCRFQ